VSNIVTGRVETDESYLGCHMHANTINSLAADSTRDISTVTHTSRKKISLNTSIHGLMVDYKKWDKYVRELGEDYEKEEEEGKRQWISK
jgi:hypothetical protein